MERQERQGSRRLRRLRGGVAYLLASLLVLAAVAAVDEPLAARRARVGLLRAVASSMSHDVPRVVAREATVGTCVHTARSRPRS
jgi:hypothetical protein